MLHSRESQPSHLWRYALLTVLATLFAASIFANFFELKQTQRSKCTDVTRVSAPSHEASHRRGGDNRDSRPSAGVRYRRRYAVATIVTTASYAFNGQVALYSAQRAVAAAARTDVEMVMMVLESLAAQVRNESAAAADTDLRILRSFAALRGVRLLAVPAIVPPYAPRQRPDLATAWVKMHAFSLLEYERVVLIDSDLVIVSSKFATLLDALPRGAALLTTPNRLRNERWNVGVMVLRPSIEVYRAMLASLNEFNSGSGGVQLQDDQDQGWFRAFFEAHGCALHGQLCYTANAVALCNATAPAAEPTASCDAPTYSHLLPLDFNRVINTQMTRSIANYVAWFGEHLNSCSMAVVHWAGWLKPWKSPLPTSPLNHEPWSLHAYVWWASALAMCRHSAVDERDYWGAACTDDDGTSKRPAALLARVVARNAAVSASTELLDEFIANFSMCAPWLRQPLE